MHIIFLSIDYYLKKRLQLNLQQIAAWWFTAPYIQRRCHDMYAFIYFMHQYLHHENVCNYAMIKAMIYDITYAQKYVHWDNMQNETI